MRPPVRSAAGLIAAAQVFGGRVLAHPGRGELGFGLGEGGFTLDSFEACRIAQLVAALRGFALLFEQGDLLGPLAGGRTFPEPEKPGFQQLAAGFVQGIAACRFGEADPAAAEFGVERGFAGQAHRAFEGSVPFIEALVRAAGRIGPALLAAEADAPFVGAGLQASAIGLFDSIWLSRPSRSIVARTRATSHPAEAGFGLGKIAQSGEQEAAAFHSPPSR